MTERVLIVEDSPTQAARLRGLLQKNGWNVAVARDGMEALAACKSDPPDIVVSDILMPKMDGLEFCRELGRTAPSVPVVLLTSLTAPLDVVRALAAGAANYVTKPYEDEELLARLRRTVRRARGEGVLDVLGERLEISASPDRLLDVLVSTLEDARRRVDVIEASHKALVESEAENRRLYEEALRSNRAKDEFLAVVSHELRTPLNAIGGWARMLRDGALDEAGRARAFDVIARNVEAQARLIEDVLDVSRIISGKLTLDKKMVSLGAVLTTTVSSFEPAAKTGDVRLELVSRLDHEMVLGDVGRLTQVLANLVGNAIKFTPRGGRVRVEADRNGKLVQITVQDNGAGIDPSFLPHVFGQFRQADTSRSRRHGGLGLGLAIAKHIVELHGGTIAAESEGKGKGATFRVTLPLAEDANSGRSDDPNRAPAQPTPLSELRILAVEDDPDARELLRLVLMNSGAVVVTASSVSEAMQALESSAHDVLISDIGLPGEDGIQLVQRVRSEPRYANLATVALTAFTGRQAEHEALAAGFDAYVEKPAPAARLIDAIHRALSHRATRMP